MEKKELSSQQEMYLKVIFRLCSEQKVARVTEIAKILSVTKATVTINLRNLSEKGLVVWDPYSLVSLTEIGESIAKNLIEKYDVLKKFFECVLRLPYSQAERNACRIEHVVDQDVIDSIEKLTDCLLDKESSWDP